ncbi:MAG: hypothetical protein N3C12_13080 [Candidatus Binatia bacterium]|nr:hypothetical protein [Candidatus Binatia bacterium]
MAGRAKTLLQAVWLPLVVLTVPVAASACSVCFAAEQRQLWAYFGTAVLLSLLPFVLFAGILLWIRIEARCQHGAVAPAGHVGDAAPKRVPLEA